jgi:Zn-dependent metalloprotease
VSSLQEEAAPELPEFDLGFNKSRLKPEAKVKQLAKSPKTTQSKPSKSNKKVSKAAKDKEDKEAQSVRDAEDAIKKLEQLTPKCLWNKTVTERETVARLNRTATLVSDLAMQTDNDDISGLKSQLEAKLNEVERSKSLIDQLQGWSGDVGETFLRSSSFISWFKSVHDSLQQTILMHLGNKLLEA